MPKNDDIFLSNIETDLFREYYAAKPKALGMSRLAFALSVATHDCDHGPLHSLPRQIAWAALKSADPFDFLSDCKDGLTELAAAIDAELHLASRRGEMAMEMLKIIRRKSSDVGKTQAAYPPR